MADIDLGFGSPVSLQADGSQAERDADFVEKVQRLIDGDLKCEGGTNVRLVPTFWLERLLARVAAAPPTAQASEGDVERVARAIDPVAWVWIDETRASDPEHLALAGTVARQEKQARAALSGMPSLSAARREGLLRAAGLVRDLHKRWRNNYEKVEEGTDTTLLHDVSARLEALTAVLEDLSTAAAAHEPDAINPKGGDAPATRRLSTTDIGAGDIWGSAPAPQPDHSGPPRTECLLDSTEIKHPGSPTWLADELASQPDAAVLGRVEGEREARDKAETLKELYEWTGSAWLAGEDDDSDLRPKLYGFLCRLIGWFLPNEPVPSEPTDTPADISALLAEFDGSATKLAAEVLRLREGGWQPIETAPRNGTKVDLWIEDEGGAYREADAHWGKPDHSCGEAGQYCDCCPPDPAWCNCFDQYLEEGSEGSLPRITHWRRSLPPSPETRR